MYDYESLKGILEKSQGAGIFVTGRPIFAPRLKMRLARRVTSVSVGPAGADIVGFLHVKLIEEETPDAMDSSLEGDTLEKIPGRMSEM